MKKIVCITFWLCIVAAPGWCAERFFLEDFEDQDFTDAFVSTEEVYCDVWTTSLAITSYAPCFGSYSLRYQASGGYSDPIESIIGDENSRINIGQLTPVSGECGIYTDLESHYTDEFAVIFRIKYDADFDWYGNCKKIIRIKENDVFGTNGMMTWAQYETYVNAYQGDEFFTDGGSVDVRYCAYEPPLNEWITIIVYMNFVYDSILFRTVDSGGTHDVYDGYYYSMVGGGTVGYQGARPQYITLVGAQCGDGTGGNRGIQLDDIEIWDGLTDPPDPPDDPIPPPPSQNESEAHLTNLDSESTCFILTIND